MNMEECLKWIMPSIKNRSVPKAMRQDDFVFRVEMAKVQYEKFKKQYKMRYKQYIGKNMSKDEIKKQIKKKMKEEIVSYVNEFLVSVMGMEKVDDPYVHPDEKKKIRKINYYKIMLDNNLVNKEDIVWIKFTTKGIISVIGTGCDIFFTENTTAGLINQSLTLFLVEDDKDIEWDEGEKDVVWDEDVVLIFPLKNIPKGLYRSDIESGIGNYLISKDVPILDYYSHNY